MEYLRKQKMEDYYINRDKILERLKQGKLNSYEATHTMRVKQAPTRVKELREAGYKISSVTLPDRSVDWYLDELPLSERPYEVIFVNEDGYDVARKVYL